MKKIVYFVAAMAAMSACQQQKELRSGIDLKNMDTTVQAGTDFYQYATGGWQEANPLTAEYSRYGSFDVLQENNNKQLRELIEGVAAQQNEAGSVAEKIAKLYNSAMDSVALNENGIAEMQKFLARENVTAAEWMQREMPRMLRQGVRGAFTFYVTADQKNSSQNILYLRQGGLTLGQKEYYLDTDEATTKIREAYRNYIVQLAGHVGFTAGQAEQMAADVMRLETFLAQHSRNMTELRNTEANYNKYAYEDLKKEFSKIDWDTYFQNFGISELKEVVVGQPEALHAAVQMLTTESAEALQNFFLWHAMDEASSYVDDASRAINFAFWGTVMSGKQQDRPRWKRAVGSVEECLGEALGQLYVAKYFPPAAKERMEQMVRNLQVALGERIDAQDWMSDSTKVVAHDKLNAFLVKVGYPSEWKDYTTLEIGDSYLQNLLACSEWARKDHIEKHLNKPVDRSEWHMTPQTVNAYYNPTTNEICFPAGILQPPFFDMEADDAFNYGAIGVVIGHEMTHGFDDQGSQYDKDGNLRQWWSQEDRDRFNERIEVMRQFHNKIEVLPGLYSNGSLTLGENIADHGGLMVALQAFNNACVANPLPEKDGFTPVQRFFLAYANLWGQNIRDEEIRKRVKSDPHSLGKWRVNGQMPHMDAWYEAFNITEQDPMFVPVEERVKMW